MRSRAVLFLILAALLWSLGGLLIKIVDWSPMAIAGARSGIAALVMLAFRPRMRFNWRAPQLGGAVCYAATVILFVVANKWTTAANAILLQYTAPVYVALLSWWFLRERITRIDVAAIAAALGGMVLFFLDDLTAGAFRGNIVAILSGVAFAGTALLLRKQKEGSPLESVFLGNILAFLIGLPAMLASAPAAGSWPGLVLLGVFQLGLSYILYAEAIRHVTALEAILVPVIEPVLNPVWVLLLLGERPGPWALLGGAVVLGSVLLRALRRRPRGHAPAS
ncbi:MAG: DMT family transporter [Acidobacteria bacterium]|nr:DMT family transporter [Acidobacteriota bacterium]